MTSTLALDDPAEENLTPAELALFSCLHYGLNHTPSDLPAVAARKCYSGGRANEDECRAALAACLASGRLQVIDQLSTARIANELRQGGYFGPIYGLPSIGAVDFTHLGAEILLSRSRARAVPSSPHTFREVVHSQTAWYFRTWNAAINSVEEAKTRCGEITVTGPIRIGPWRAQWWRLFPEGYRIDVEERRQWQGHNSMGEGLLMPRRENPDLQRLRHILDTHNVRVVE
jgi:hypothetical protein